MSESPRQEADSSTKDSRKEFTECPTCGRGDFESDRGIRQHHARSHGESLTKKTYTCEWCGDEFKKLPSNENIRFCSNGCKFDFLHEQNSGRNLIQVDCDNCGNTLKRQPNEIEKYDNFFCDRACKNDWLGGENHHWYQGGSTVVECCVCGEEKEVPPNRAKEYDRHFCYEKGCRYDWISENLSGENHANWKGGVSGEYPGGWQRIREKVKEDDNYECQVCGISQSESKEKNGYGLDVHHVVPVRKFENPEDAHDKQNLVTACRSCHMEWEGVPVFPDNRKE